MMPTDDVTPPVETVEQTPEKETPAKETTKDPAPADPSEVEDLKEQLAAAEEAVEKAETDAKRWKGRVEKKTKEPKTDEPNYVTKEDLWKRDNQDRIELVQEQYDEIIADGFNGEKVSPPVALELAEKKAKVTDGNSVEKARSDDITTPDSTKRNIGGNVELSDYDKRMGLTAESKKELLSEHPELASM